MLDAPLTYLFAFIVALGLLVVVHEFGHFIVARACGVKVLRFAVGFGRVLWSRRYGPDQTEWALCAIPLGGYVKMLDEREGPVAAAELSRAFTQQSLGRRSLIVLAGPVANLALKLDRRFTMAFFIGKFSPVIGHRRQCIQGRRLAPPVALFSAELKRAFTVELRLLIGPLLPTEIAPVVIQIDQE